MEKCTAKFLKPSSTITLSLLALAVCFLTPGPLHCAATVCPCFRCLLGVHCPSNGGVLPCHWTAGERASVQWRPRAACREVQNARHTSYFSRFSFILCEYTRLTAGGSWRRRPTPHACTIAKGRVARHFHGRRTQTTRIFATFARFSRHRCSLGRIFRYFLVRFSA
uniref:Putative secreted protein n=1 Tax=Ixodes ricinus TaxID=34613 RepID=A0A6B0UXB0_IXORI